MFDLYPRREPPWDVVEYKEVAQVPMIFDDTVSILPNDVSQTFTFNCPSKVRPPRRTLSRSSSVSSTVSSLLTLSRSSSNSSSSSDMSDTTRDRQLRGGAAETRPTEFTPDHVRDAVVFARNELLASVEMRKLGANVLFFEGWSVTKLRKGSSDQYRLQVRYTGRPAVAVFHSAARTTPMVPPFLDVTEGW
ncbi:hypothetical protein FRB90_001538 [Tulasnella sp. 427]|nr:hypothetical protein FRB90_001538 [Tulasnella sp. 427]